MNYKIKHNYVSSAELNSYTCVESDKQINNTFCLEN